MNHPDELSTGAVPSNAGVTVTTDVSAGDSVQLVSPLVNPSPEAGVTLVTGMPADGSDAHTIMVDVSTDAPGDKTIHS